MTIFRAIPVSLAILWRFLLVFPFVVLAIVLCAMIAFFPTLLFTYVSPLFGVGMLISFIIASSVVPAMVGTRLGLTAYQVKTRNSYLGLMIPAIGYGILEGVCTLIMFGLAVASFVYVTPLSLDDLSQMAASDTAELVASLMAANAGLAIALIVFGAFAIASMRAALLVPFAGASVGRDPNGQLHTAFLGFGCGFFSMLILVAASYALMLGAVPIVIYGLAELGHAEMMSVVYERFLLINNLQDFANIVLELLVFASLCLFVYLMAFSIQCAGAVVIFLQLIRNVDTGHKMSDKEVAMLSKSAHDNPEMRDLVRSRMPPRR